MSYQVEWTFDGHTGTSVMTEREIKVAYENGIPQLISVKPSKSMQRMIDAEVKAYNEGDLETLLHYERYWDGVDRL